MDHKRAIHSFKQRKETNSYRFNEDKIARYHIDLDWIQIHKLILAENFFIKSLLC